MRHVINYAAILFGITAVLWIVTSDAGRIWRIVSGSFLGFAALTIVSRVLPSVSVGINAVTCLFCGILGIPGFFTLFILKLLI